MISCAKVLELQSESHGGQLDWKQRLGMWLHMRLCPPCARSEQSLCRTLDLLRDLGASDRRHSSDPPAQSKTGTSL